MKLDKIIESVVVKPTSSSALSSSMDIKNLVFQSKDVNPGSLFVAIRGSQKDAHEFLPEAVQKGACALVVENASKVPADFKGPVLVVQNSREALEKMAHNFFQQPTSQIFCAGVTGTNGKTSITYLVEAILKQKNILVGVMGTVDHHCGDKVWPSSLTTPDAVTFHRRVREFIDYGAKACVFEISSHALDQKRVERAQLDVGIFTNLTQDHLDYHKNMDSYFMAKHRLFTNILAESSKSKRYAVINTDDSWGQKIVLPKGIERWDYGGQRQTFAYHIKELGLDRSVFELQTPFGKKTFTSQLLGEHNVANCTAALATALAQGQAWSSLDQPFADFLGVPGRLERVPNNKGVHAYVDYAHTPDALEKVLQFLNQIRQKVAPKAKIILVFGCGGDRDQEKRPLMAKAAEKASAYVVLTSDNPRFEDPKKIIQDIEVGFSKTFREQCVRTEEDRNKALKMALEMANPGDLLLVAGKGHEKFQQIGNEKKPMDDVEVLRGLM